jgi:hypothetical protein
MGKSGHSGGTGVLKDYEKLCLAAELGWRVFLLDEYLETIARAIEPPELTAIGDIDEIAVNCQPNQRPRQRDTSGVSVPSRLRELPITTGYITSVGRDVINVWVTITRVQ